MGGASSAGTATTRDGLCVSKAFQFLGFDINLGPDPVFTALPTLLRKFSRKFTFITPFHWKLPGLLDQKRTDTAFAFNAPAVICTHAAKTDTFLLRVLLPKLKNPLHVVLVHSSCVVDPDDGIWRPLCQDPDPFALLGVGEILEGFKIHILV